MPGAQARSEAAGSLSVTVLSPAYLSMRSVSWTKRCVQIVNCRISRGTRDYLLATHKR